MSKELKIRIDDYKDIETNLLRLGAKFIKESVYKYTYFNQPAGTVLKITEVDNKAYLSRLKEDRGQFNILPPENLSDKEEVIKKLTKEFGTSKRLVNKRRFFNLGSNEISTNQIVGVGQFLIIESNMPKLDLARKITGHSNPEIITKPFDQI